MPKQRSNLPRIKQGVLSRGFSLAKLSLTAGARAATHAVGGLFQGEEAEPGTRLKILLKSQAEILAKELGELKGSVMKVGQMLSMYGEHFLPPEANELLKSLQSQAPPLAWPEIERTLRRQLGGIKLAELEIDPEPLAAASLGQVHLARRSSETRHPGVRQLAIKVQYPGVDRSIDSDLKALRTILSLSRLLPGQARYDEIFKEVRAMLHQEVDYRKEFEATQVFRELLRGDLRYVIPEPIARYSTGRVLTTVYEPGHAIDSPEVQALPEERRNRLGRAALELYLREIFEFGMVQTDPHFGNYRVRLGEGGEADRLVLIDFGAVRKFPKNFREAYRQLVGAASGRDRIGLEEAALALGFLHPDDPAPLRERFVELCYLLTEPFASETPQPYAWGEGDLPRRVAAKAGEVIFSTGILKLRAPPREIVFLDRKMTGMFVFLAALRARLDARGVLSETLAAPRW